MVEGCTLEPRRGRRHGRAGGGGVRPVACVAPRPAAATPAFACPAATRRPVRIPPPASLGPADVCRRPAPLLPGRPGGGLPRAGRLA